MNVVHNHYLPKTIGHTDSKNYFSVDNTSNIDTDSLPSYTKNNFLIFTEKYKNKYDKLSLQLSLDGSDKSFKSLIDQNFRLSNSAINLSYLPENSPKSKSQHSGLQYEIDEQYKYDFDIPGLDYLPNKEEYDKSSLSNSSHNTLKNTMKQRQKTAALPKKVDPNLMWSPANQQPPVTDTSQIISCLKVGNIDVQINAAAYLQHLTYHNEDTKNFVRINNGIPALISLLQSPNQNCQINVAGVLRNLSHGSNMQIKKQIQECKGLEAISSMLTTNCLDSCKMKLLENLTAILCNISGYSMFHSVLSIKLMDQVINSVLLPYLNNILSDKSNNKCKYQYIPQCCPLVEFSTSFLRNMSSSTKTIRHKLRNYSDLIVKMNSLVNFCGDKGQFDCKSVENSVCILRNLSFGLQKAYRSASPTHETSQVQSATKFGGVQFPKDSNNNVPKSKKKVSISSKNSLMGSNSSSNNNNGGYNTEMMEDVGLLSIWNDEVIQMLVRVINDCSNYEAVEAAIGTVQNLAAGSWHFAQEFRYQFRKKTGLPALVIQIINGPDKIIRIAVSALRNLAEDIRNLELVIGHCLLYLIRCLPNPSRPVVKRQLLKNDNSDLDIVKVNNDNNTNDNNGNNISNINNNNNDDDDDDESEEYLSLDTIYHVLSLIYFVISSNKISHDVMVRLGGVKCCMFLLRSDTFYREHLTHVSNNQPTSQMADRIPILAASILQQLWLTSYKNLQSKFKREGWSAEDFCVQGTIDSFKANVKMAGSCSMHSDGAAISDVYYGKPYDKAINKTLLPWTYHLIQRQPTVVVSCEQDEEIISDSFHRSAVMPDFSQDSTEINRVFLPDSDSNNLPLNDRRQSYPPIPNITRPAALRPETAAGKLCPPINSLV